MRQAVARAQHEIRRMMVAAAFFATGFCLIHVSNQLFTEGSTVQIARLSQAIIGAFLVAKVLALVDLLPWVDAFPDPPLVLNIVWKTSLYVLGGVVFLYIEPFLKNIFKGSGMLTSHLRAWQELILPRTWATIIWLGILLAFFVTLQELGRALGKEQLKHLLLGRKGRQTTGAPSPLKPLESPPTERVASQ